MGNRQFLNKKMKVKALVFPNHKQAGGFNPYQELIYNNFRNREDINIKYLNCKFLSVGIFGKLILPLKLILYRLRGYNCFHLQFLYPFVPPMKNRIVQAIYFFYFIFCLFFIKKLGYKLIWTIHEILPHEKQFVNDLAVRRILSKFCDAKIIHSKNTIEELEKSDLNIRNIYIIPHGNYIGVYKDNITKNDARRHLKFNQKDFVFLFFGRIEPYKGIEELLKIFKKLAKKEKNIKLLIAGKCDNKNLKEILNNYKKEHKEDVGIYTDFIENDKVQYYFNCADIAVYPFKKITTSSSVILALSFGKPVICPRIGDLKELRDLGFFYKPKDKDGLFKCMEKAIVNKEMLEKMSKKASKYAKSLSWDEVANKTYGVYKKVLKL